MMSFENFPTHATMLLHWLAMRACLLACSLTMLINPIPYTQPTSP